MKLSLSVLLVVAAALNVSAYKVPYAAQSCALGTEGKGLGNGFKGYCCKNQADCIDDCVNEKCTGPEGTIHFTTTASIKTKTKTTSTAKHTSTTAAKCIPGSAGKKNGEGRLNACCTTSDDCKNSCVNKKCDAN
ncbi:hypothetical protein INT47_005278 [Mucor saturninus]|uniref:Uncharacterized protein n=1 Tax=Mucor saturninus TaxID=64648 RepID=A0A8H7R8P0_9FUNG|nr:hypothetical protein INT47_005278 [Mucor saturninus]